MKKFTEKILSSAAAAAAAVCLLTTLAPIAHAADFNGHVCSSGQELGLAAQSNAESENTYTLTVDGIAESRTAGDTVQLSALFYTNNGKAYRFSHWTGDTYLLADSTNPDISFVMPASAVTLNKNFVLVGDINCDGEINSIDSLQLKKMIAGILRPTLAGDINNDGRWDDEDAELMRKMIVGLYTPTE